MNINATSLNAINNMRLADNMVSLSMSRLSSGMKINYATDAPSDLAIVKNLTSISRGSEAALTNVQEGLSMIQQIDKPLAEIQDMLMRMKDLALRASNEAVLVSTCQDRTRLNKEAQSLLTAIDKIAKTIRFNGKKVLSGDHLVSITETPGSAQTLQTAASNPVNPSWADNNTVVFTVDVNATGSQTGARPSSGGETTQRVFSWDINTNTNAPVTSKQLSRDPGVLSDPDADGYFDSAGRVNDPDNNNALYPVNDPDADNDGWRATVDNNDNDSTETGTDLRTLNPDRTLPINTTTTSQDASVITWQNAVTRTFTAGVVDQADIQSTSGNTYSVEIFDTGANAWTTVAAGLTGNNTIDFAETNANSIRVVYDEPVSQLAGVTNITGIRNKDVTLNAAAPVSPPDTYKYSYGAPTQIDSLTVDGSAGNFTIYKNVGGTVSAIGGGTAGTPVTVAPGANVSDIWVDFDTAGATVTQFDAVENVAVGAPALSGTDGIQDFYLVNVPGGPKNISDLDITLSNAASPYDIYYNGNVPPGVPDDSGVGSGPKSLGGSQNLSQFYIAVPTGESVTGVTASNVLGTPAPAQEQRYTSYALATPGQTVTSIDIEVTNGVQFQLFDDGGAAIGGVQTGLGAGSPVTVNAGSINPNAIEVRFSVGASDADILAAPTAKATYALGAATNGFADVNPQNENVAVYQIDTSAGLADRSFDQITIDVKNGHPFSVEYSDDGVTWNAIATMTNVTGTGAPATYSFTDTLVDTSGNGDAYFRVTMHSGEKIATAVNGNPTFTNRIDRDGDGFPDVIETNRGSNPDLQTSMPDGAVASDPMNPQFAPDDDGDNMLDAPLLYDTKDVDFLASTNPYNAGWTSGTGNPLNATGPGAQYPNAGDMVDASQVPSTTDSDGDTYADPLDPFPNVAEFATWVDGAGTQGPNDMVFVSNRANPNDPATTYLYQATAPNGSGTYQTYAQIAGTQGADDPTYSADGAGLAWEQNGGIQATLATTVCGGTFGNTYTVTANGENPNWSPDNSQIAFERGGMLYIINSDGSNETPLGVAGSNPSWLSDGDTIAFDSGGQLFAYNTVTEATYDMGIAGTNPYFSPDGTKVAYIQNGNLMVSSLTIDRQPPVVQVGGYNGENFQIELSYPDARAGSIGLTGMTIINQSDAQDAIDTIEAAITKVSDYRANTAYTEKRLLHVADDLNMFRISLESSRSKLEDTDMAMETVSYLRGQVLRDSAQATTVHSADILRTSVLSAIQETLGRTA